MFIPKFADDIVKKNYLIQLYAIDPSYALSVYEGLPEKPTTFTMDEVADKSKTAHLVGKNPNFLTADQGRSFMGMPIGGRACHLFPSFLASITDRSSTLCRARAEYSMGKCPAGFA